MLHRFLPFALTLSLLCPLAASAQTPPAAPTAPAVTAPDTASADPSAKKHPHVGGKITAVDAAARTITLKHGRRVVVLSVPATTKIYKPGDLKGQPTGTFADLTLDSPVNAALGGESSTPTAKTIHIRLPKTTMSPGAPAVP